MKLIRNIFCTLYGIITSIVLKIINGKRFTSSPIIYVSPFSDLEIRSKAKFRIGYHSIIRNGAKIRIEKDAELSVGSHFACGNDSWIVCHDLIEIGDNVQFGPGVLVYDHDHDFSHPDGLKANHFKCSPVKIGNSVWIGARTIILRGTTIGDNCVVGAGCILKGNYPPNSVIVAKQNIVIKPYTKQEKQ